MNRYNFTIRIYKDECRNPVLSDLNNITISDITIISKPQKFDGICEHNGNKKKFKYSFKLNKKFNNKEKGFIASFTSTKITTDVLIKNIKKNKKFNELKKFDELICIAVDL